MVCVGHRLHAIPNLPTMIMVGKVFLSGLLVFLSNIMFSNFADSFCQSYCTYVCMCMCIRTWKGHP